MVLAYQHVTRLLGQMNSYAGKARMSSSQRVINSDECASLDMCVYLPRPSGLAPHQGFCVHSVDDCLAAAHSWEEFYKEGSS